MGTRLVTFVIATAVASPAVMAAQPAHTPRADDIRVQSRVVVQQERDRSRQRIVESRGRHEERETVNRSVRIGNSGELSLTSLAGDITVTRGSGADLQIEAVKTARGQNAEDARQMLQLLRIDITERGSRVDVKTVYPSAQELPGPQRRQFNASVAYNITAPSGTRLSIRTVSGTVKVTDIRGELSLESTSGDVVITGGERITTAKTISGNVNVLNSTSQVPFEAHTISGHVTLRQVKAPRVELGSVSGNVIIGEVEIPTIEAQSMSGDVEFNSPFAKGGRYEFSSHAGTVRLVIGGGTGFELEVSSFGGSIQVDPSLGLKNEDDNEGRRRQRSFRAVHGDASAMVEATAFSGRVIVTKR